MIVKINLLTRCILIAVLWISFIQLTLAQRNPSTGSNYMESAGEGKHYFYFDSYYYLNSKDCQYVQIIRTSAYDLKEQQFTGAFVDHALNGHKLLEGQYENSHKSGVFTAYHTNGHIKWTGTYQDDIPVGDWKYFYPDGKPMLVVQIRENGVFIQDYFDTKGKARVQNGTGKYEMKIEIENFNDFGSLFINKKGNIRDGKPSGRWEISLISENGKKDYLNTDSYQDGRLIVSEFLDDEVDLFGQSRTAILPIDWFLNAENLSFKTCSIDEQSGFLGYLVQKIDSSLEQFRNMDVESQWVEYHVSVNKQGAPKSVKSIEPHQDRTLERYFMAVLGDVPYWIPSYFDGEYIDDLLTIRVLVGQAPNTNHLVVFDLVMNREKGI